MKHQTADRGDGALFDASLDIIRAGQAAGGAFAASPTFSQYRYCWIRDGAFIAEALDLVGERECAARFHDWVTRVVAASAAGMGRAMASARRGRIPATRDHLHCRYELDGCMADADWPTFQLDGPGIWLWALAHHEHHGGRLDEDVRDALRRVARYLAVLWQTPCADAWEEFPEHVHTSTLAAIAAGLRAAVRLEPGLAGEPDIRAARDAVEARLSSWVGAFTKWAGSDEVDASLLWIVAPYELMPPREPRFAAMLSRLERELISVDGGVHRYRSDTYYGGGAWPVLTAAYGRVLLRRDAPGDQERAAAALRWIEQQADPRGGLPEQVADHALAPGRIAEWRGRWGESARPLLWSHAAYLSLRTELEARTGASARRR